MALQRRQTHVILLYGILYISVLSITCHHWSLPISWTKTGDYTVAELEQRTVTYIKLPGIHVHEDKAVHDPVGLIMSFLWTPIKQLKACCYFLFKSSDLVLLRLKGSSISSILCRSSLERYWSAADSRPSCSARCPGRSEYDTAAAPCLRSGSRAWQLCVLH